MRLYARVLPGLEALCAEEVSGLLRAERVETGKGRVEFGCPLPQPGLRSLLVCDSLCLLVRRSEGDFGGRGGLTALRAKLARTDFDRHLARWAQPGLPAVASFRVRAVVGKGCEFAFFDVVREATAILARRLDLPPAETGAPLVVDLECSPTDLHIGLALPLPDWTDAPRRAAARSLAGALVRLARPAPQLAVCDPDCGSGELLRAWALAARRPRLLGLTLGRRSDAGRDGPPCAAASPRAWPVGAGRLSRVLSLLPRINDPAQLAHLLDELTRCLAVGGRAVFATALTGAWRTAVEALPRLTLERSLRVQDGDRRVDVIVLTRSPDARTHATSTTAGARARATKDLADRLGKRRSLRARRGGKPAKRDPT
ncbi:MAG: hypothetical protein FJX74_19255 [Armatimonadetes bacterium]|nr:hypothetical protein [Armatimonadota bacterium]